MNWWILSNNSLTNWLETFGLDVLGHMHTHAHSIHMNILLYLHVLHMNTLLYLHFLFSSKSLSIIQVFLMNKMFTS